jgi:hypothetical protein
MDDCGPPPTRGKYLLMSLGENMKTGTRKIGFFLEKRNKEER